jgi:hypothetical protein
VTTKRGEMMALIIKYTGETATHFTRDAHMGEFRLLAEVINRAVRDLLREDDNDFWVRDAAEWFKTTSDKPIEFSFEWCCEGLGIEPDVIRLGLIKIGALQGE